MLNNQDHDGLVDYVMVDINEWKTHPFNIGVIGASGVGKSSFINKIRGVKKGDPTFAKVGVKGDTTVEKASYPHPNNEKVVFWDLPGVGTPRFKQDESYLEYIEIAKIDFFLILYVTTIQEGDIWIAKQMERHAKRFSFIITHADKFYDDEDLDDNLTPEERILAVKEKCKTTLEQAGLPKAFSVYAISNKNVKCGEFGTFVDDFLCRLEDIEKEALGLTLAAMTKGTIEEKARILKANAWKVALAAGVAGSTPIAGIDALMSIPVLVGAVVCYLAAFELTEEKLRNIPGAYAKEQLTCQEIHKIGAYQFCVLSVAKISVNIASSYTLKYLLPVFGSVIYGVTSFGAMYTFLTQTIDKLAEDATTMLGIRVTTSIPIETTTKLGK